MTTDGDVLVDVDGTGPLPAFTGKNISGWRSGGTCDCPPDVVHAYTKVRILIDQSPMKLFLDDTTFSTTNRGTLGCESGNPA